MGEYIWGTAIAVFKGDTRSLDTSSPEGVALGLGFEPCRQEVWGRGRISSCGGHAQVIPAPRYQDILQCSEFSYRKKSSKWGSRKTVCGTL